MTVLPSVRLCPSAEPSDEAYIFGVVGKGRETSYFSDPVPLDDNLISKLSSKTDVGRRFRISAACEPSRCGNWTNRGCRLAAAALNLSQSMATPEEVVLCGIRERCRWYAQVGSRACQVCRFVVRDVAAK